MRMTARVVAVVTAATMTVGLAACGADDGGGKAAGAPGTASAASTTSAAPSPTPRATDANGFPLPERPACAAESGGEFVRATTSEGNARMLILGEGESGVVLGPQDGGDICMMLAYGEELATRYRVALLNWKEPSVGGPVARGQGAAGRRSGPGGARWRVVRRGARDVGSPPGPPAAGRRAVVRRRADAAGRGLRPGIRRWHGPLLEISSKQDAYFDSADARRLRALHPGRETVLMLPGSLHGVDMLEGPQQEQVRATVDEFLDRVLG